MTKVLLRVQQLTLAPRMEHYGVLQIGDQIRHTRAACNNMLTLRELLGQPLVHRELGGPNRHSPETPNNENMVNVRVRLLPASCCTHRGYKRASDPSYLRASRGTY